MRKDGRRSDELRPVTIERNFTKFSPGSVLIEFGETKVICTASVEESVPGYLKNTGKGWITAEYSLLPGSTARRASREATRGKVSGRTQEIQRLIGRSLRSIVNLSALGERTIWIDCDVIQADGGTRVASITGAYVALIDAINWLKKNGKITGEPVLGSIAAVSVGIVNGESLLDLCYEEDFEAQVDMNVVLTGEGRYIELQGTGEEYSFSDEELSAMISQAKQGINQLTQIQQTALDE
ncbi:MAG: ribonuclease PH [Candidatus Scalindua sp.]|nr:ribonuclease PH [Candidatus Scalindua sp.]